MPQKARPTLFLLTLALTTCLAQTPSASAAPRFQDGPQPQPQSGAVPSKKTNDDPIPPSQVHNPVLWQEPTDIASRDLFYGQGGPKHQPQAPYVFLSEDSSGTNPKFDVRDANNKKWRVKMGAEARPEVVASRLLWAVGYFANDDYLVHEATIQNLDLKRGRDHIHRLGKDGQVLDVRFARKPGGQDKIAIWTWKDNPFTGTREFNGLRVMMAVINNWDLKDVNNAVYVDKDNDRQIFLASDVGATFGSNDYQFSHSKAKGNAKSFEESKFIEKQDADTVSFGTPKAPGGLAKLGVLTPAGARRSALDWIGNNIPKEHARWMGSLLSQLTHQQLVDAFRAGNFPPDEINTYVKVIEDRIAELKTLQ